MAITKMKNGSFMVSVGSRGTRVRKVFKTLLEAKEFEKNPTPTKKEGMAERKVTLRDLLRRTKVLKWQNDSGKQEANAELCVKFFGEKELISSITRKQINNLVEYLYAKGNSSSTINRKLSAFSMMLKVAEEEGLIPFAFRMPRQKEGQNRKRIITPAEEILIYKVCDELGMADLKDYIQFTIDTGFRKMESLMIKTRDCQGGVAELFDGETKSGKGRRVPLTSRAKEIVAKRRRNRRLFEGMNEYSLRRDWDTLRRTLGFDSTFIIHSLRHTCASRLGMAGKNAFFIKEWMGHSSVVVSQQYVHLNVNHLVEGAEALSQLSQGQ